MDAAEVYIPIDRRLALASNTPLPEQSSGSVLFADISGFTPITELLVRRLGPRRGPETLTHLLNQLYDALIAEVHRYRGSVIGFSGDAITCWLDGDDGRRATTCALAMQQAMQQFADIEVLPGERSSLAMKVAIAVGPVRRFLVGNPDIQVIDVLAGTTLERMAAAEKHANRGEIVLAPGAFAALRDSVSVVEMRQDDDNDNAFAVINAMTNPVAPDPWPTLDTPLPEEQVWPWLFRPIYERLKRNQGQFIAELRPAVPLFLRFGGIDYDHDPDAGAKLDAYIRWIQGIFEQYGGFLIQLTVGDKGSYLYGEFGAPIAHDDDPLRAVMTALEVQSPPPELAFIGPVQIGITRGQMRTGAYGSTTRYTYGVLGDDVNLAARLMTYTEPGQVLVTQRIANATSHAYAFESQGAIQVKGKSAPIEVSLVRGPKNLSLHRTMVKTVGPMVGREAELTVLENALDAMLAGTGHVVLMEGSAGVGKSYLTAEFAIRAARRGVQVFPGACQSINQNVPYVPWRQIFRAFFALSDEQPDETHLDTFLASEVAQVEMMLLQMIPDKHVLLPLLGDVLGLPIPDNTTTMAFDARQRQESLLTLAIEILHHWASDIPLLLIIEDAHWVDEASRSLLMACSRSLSGSRLLLLLVQRPPLNDDDSDDDDASAQQRALEQLPNYQRLNLNELSPDAITALMTQRLQGEPSPLVSSLIQIKTQGNPFFTEELLDALRETGHLVQQENNTWSLSDEMHHALDQANCLVQTPRGDWIIDPDAPLSTVELGIPETVQGAVLARLDRLPEEHKLTLKVASVIGRVFMLNVLARAHPSQVDMDKLLGEFTVIDSRDFTFLEMPPPQPVYMFKHNVTQEVTYGTLLETQQQTLHRAVAETIEQVQPDAVEQLAYHYLISGVRDKTLHYLDLAARKTQRAYSNQAALRYYEQALALENRWQWHKGRVEILHILGRREEEADALRELEASPDVPPFNLAYLWGQYYEAIGDYPHAQEQTERALAAAQASNTLLDAVRCMNQLGLIAFRQGDNAASEVWHNRVLQSLENGEPLEGESAWALANALDSIGWLRFYHGNFTEAQDFNERALALYRATDHRKGEADVLNSLGLVLFNQRNLTEAVRAFQQSLEIRLAIGDRVKQGASLVNLGMTTHYQGAYEQGEAYLLQSLEILHATDDRWNQCPAYNMLGIIYTSLGLFAQAREMLERGLKVSREIGNETVRPYLLASLGSALKDEGDLDVAQQYVHEALTLMQAQEDRYGVAECLKYLALIDVRAGRFAQAIEQADESLLIFREIELPMIMASTMVVLAEAHLAQGNTEMAREYAMQVIAILDECNGVGPDVPHHDYFICSRVLAATGESDAAQAALQAAYRLLMDRANMIDNPTTRQSLLEQVPLNRDIVQAMGG